jgi:1,4-dihydroxy-2-naphthoyl-CoA hydrolase
MPFIYHCKVHFGDTDAAGVVYFTNLLKFCHQAYEASLSSVGIDLKEFFGRAQVAVPITQATVDFLRPLYCGDRLTIHLNPQLLEASSFQVNYQIFADNAASQLIGRASTTHVCIAVHPRARIDLTPVLVEWMQHWHKSGPGSPLP